MFHTNDPGIHKFVERFEKECQILRTINHVNIVQYLGISRDLQSGRLTLLMELMDESLTKFLERSTGPIPFHIQLNVSHDVALALDYLHSNAIIHRDLSSNNVLLIGEGIKAKVTDFGMSKLVDLNPRMTPLTMCPGTPAYMPPEARASVPVYSNKLDCFSHGVLSIQLITRQFPAPGDAHYYRENPSYPTGREVIEIPEVERRQRHISLVDPDHPLLPLALHCLKDRDAERPSASDLCEKIAQLKLKPRYLESAAHAREQIPSPRQSHVESHEEAIQPQCSQNVDINEKVKKEEARKAHEHSSAKRRSEQSKTDTNSEPSQIVPLKQNKNKDSPVSARETNNVTGTKIN